MTIEEELKELMIKKSGSVNKFSSECGLSTSTVATIFSRGVNKTNINTIIKICQRLNISVDELSNGRITYISTLPGGGFHGGEPRPDILIDFDQLSDKNKEQAMTYIKYLLETQKGEEKA